MNNLLKNERNLMFRYVSQPYLFPCIVFDKFTTTKISKLNVLLSHKTSMQFFLVLWM